MTTTSSSSSASASPVLSVRDLTITLPKGADRPHAVADISFDVSAGQIVCLLGESGSGKSVIASTVMGLMPEGLHATGGQVLLAGRDVLRCSADEMRQIRGAQAAMVFQEPMTALNPVMTCGAQVEEVLAQHTALDRAGRRARVLEIFGHVRLPEPERIYASFPHQLSGGQRQRIVIAMALILKPALLICDEPTTALDVTTQAEILKLIRELQSENGTAVLFITHDFGVVAEIADEVVVLQLGQMIERGSKQQVLTAPREDYTRSLLDAVLELEPAERPELPHSYPLLEVQHLFKTYETRRWPARPRIVHAVNDISLRLHAGETIGIVGESGSGKSTFARCVARLIEPTAGDIFSDGRSVARAGVRALYPFRKVVQVVFQDPYRSLNPRQKVGESIIEGPVNFGVPRAQAWAEAEELMRLVRMKPEALHRYPSEFSGGQRQRISIARALACKPKVLIADEAVSALDVSVQSQILRLLDDIQQALKIGILFITHDLRVASRICDRIVVLHQGKVVEEGVAKELFLTPQSDYTRTLMAAAPGRGYRFARSPLPEAEALAG